MVGQGSAEKRRFGKQPKRIGDVNESTISMHALRLPAILLNFLAMDQCDFYIKPKVEFLSMVVFFGIDSYDRPSNSGCSAGNDQID